MPRPLFSFAPASVAAIVLVAGLLGCGGGDGGGGGPSSSGAEGEIEETIITWLLEGDCDLMTDKFLEDQVLIGDDDSRAENCELFENFFIEKQYDADDVKITDVEITGSEASAVVGDDISNFESTYTLVKEGGRWRIDSSEF